MSHHGHSTRDDPPAERDSTALARELIAEVHRIRAIRAELRETYLRLLPRSIALSLDDQDIALNRIEQLARLLAEASAGDRRSGSAGR